MQRELAVFIPADRGEPTFMKCLTSNIRERYHPPKCRMKKNVQGVLLWNKHQAISFCAKSEVYNLGKRSSYEGLLRSQAEKHLNYTIFETKQIDIHIAFLYLINSKFRVWEMEIAPESKIYSNTEVNNDCWDNCETGMQLSESMQLFSRMGPFLCSFPLIRLSLGTVVEEVSIPWYIFKLDQVSQVIKNQRCTVNLDMDILIMRIVVKEGDVRTTPLARLIVPIHKWKDLIHVEWKNEEIKQLDIWIPGHPKMQINGCSHRTN